jgi:hypothetical protein
MPKNSSLSLAMRGKGVKDGVGPMSPRSPGSPNAVYGADSEAATPTAPYHNMPESPASPKIRKDSKSIFSNFGATKSSTRIAQDNSIRRVPDQDLPHSFYTNGRNGGSTPELNRPVQTPNSDGKHQSSARMNHLLTSEDHGPDMNGSGKSHETTENNLESNGSKRAPKLKKQGGGMLSRSKSIKIEDSSGNRAKLRANPPKISPDPSGSWGTNGDGGALKTAPLEKGQSWRQNISFNKLRTHSADRHDPSLQSHRDDDASSRRDRAEQSSLTSGSYNENRGAALMSNLGSGARKMGERMESARKGIFGKLGRSSSNHERELQIPKEQYQFKIIHQPLVEQTRLTRISNRLEASKDKTEFWMPALPWRCIEYVLILRFFLCVLTYWLQLPQYERVRRRGLVPSPWSCSHRQVLRAKVRSRYDYFSHVSWAM